MLLSVVIITLLVPAVAILTAQFLRQSLAPLALTEAPDASIDAPHELAEAA